MSSAPPISFLFTVGEVTVNEDTENGGVHPRANEDGYWVPPIQRNGYFPAAPGRLYRWSDGHITHLTGFRAAEERWNHFALTPYKTSTMFWCSTLAHFRVATGDVTSRDMESSEPPDNHWWPVSFRSDPEFSLARIEESGELQWLDGVGEQWIRQLGLEQYRYAGSPNSRGLSGSLTMIIALIAFSCVDYNELHRILIRENVWGQRQWRGHTHNYGSKQTLFSYPLLHS